MNPVTERELQAMIDEYLEKVPPILKLYEKTDKEGSRFWLSGQKEYLLIKKANMSHLTVQALRRLPIFLIQQMHVHIEYDNLWYWGIIDHLVESSKETFYEKWPAYAAFQTLITAQFCRVKPPKILKLIKEDPRFSDIIPADTQTPPIGDLISESWVVHGYLCYPVLESLVKFAMPTVIDLNGNLKQKIKVNGKKRKKSDTISSLAMLLKVLEKYSSSNDLRGGLKDFKRHAKKMLNISKESKVWDEIYNFRNITLHGQEKLEQHSALITNLICLILCYLIDDAVIERELRQFQGFTRNYMMYRGRIFLRVEELKSSLAK